MAKRTVDEVFAWVVDGPERPISKLRILLGLTGHKTLTDLPAACDLLIAAGTIHKLSTRLTCSHTDLKTYYTQAGLDPTDVLDPEKDIIFPDLSANGIGDLPFDPDFYQRRIHALEASVKKWQNFYANMRDIMLEVLPTLPPVPIEYPQNWDADVDEELCFLKMSDVHVGERVLSAETSGLSEYSFDMFKHRCDEYVNAVDSIVNGILRRAYPIRHAYLNILGDLTTGEAVFPKQMARIDRDLHHQIIEGAYYLSHVVRFLSSQFTTLTVQMVPGNHGKQRETTLNTDVVLYEMLAVLLRDQPNIKWVLSDSPLLGFYLDGNVADRIGFDFQDSDLLWNFLLAHGSEALSWQGIPYYGLDRMHSRLTVTAGIIWDTIFAGHHHRQASLENVELIGSWLGGTGYSVDKMQSASRPMQKLFGFHPKKGLTFRYPLYLGDRPRLTIPEDPTSGVYTPHNELLDFMMEEAPVNGSESG